MACPPSIPRGAHAHVVALSKNAKSSEMAMFTREMMVNHNFLGHPTFRQSLVLWNVNTCCRVGDICHTIPCLFPSCSTAMAPTGPRSCPAAARYFQSVEADAMNKTWGSTTWVCLTNGHPFIDGKLNGKIAINQSNYKGTS